MWLRNFDNLTCALLGYYTETGGATTPQRTNDGSDISVFGDGHVNVKQRTGSIATVRYVTSASSNGNSIYTSRPLYLSKSNICIGTGNTPVTYDDFNLSGEILDNTKLVYVSDSKEYSSDYKKLIKTVVFTYHNDTSSPITISEWGLFYYNGSSNISSATKFDAQTYNTLCYREVLDSPITIAEGTTGTLTFKVEIPFFNHP